MEESRVAEARSKLRAKARSRFLQRREDALMGFEVSRKPIIEACIVPERRHFRGEDGRVSKRTPPEVQR